jgi:polyisoprenoid-binding protein YceI
MSHQTLQNGNWNIDPRESHARFVAASMGGLVKTPGRFRALTGSLTANGAGTSGLLTIDAASIDTGNRLRDRHLRGRDFFGVIKHPEMVYQLRDLQPAGADRVRIDGDLLIAGTRTNLPLDASIRIQGHETVAISTQAKVDRIALGIRGARMMVPRMITVDVAVVLRRDEG